MAEVTLEFVGQQLALVIEEQREIKARHGKVEAWLGKVEARLDSVESRLGLIEATLRTLATKDLVTQVRNALDNKLHASELGEQLLRERLERRVAELERARP
jgi:hypothetical protein